MSGHADAVKAQQRLREAGVETDFEGSVRFTQAAQAEYAASPWVSDFPIRGGSIQTAPILTLSRCGGWMPGAIPKRFISRITRHLDGLAAARMWTNPAGPLEEQRYNRQVMLSSGGALAGTIWTEIPRQTTEYFQQGHFQHATRKRLGLARAPPGATCRIPNKNGQATPCCGEVLDYRLTHPGTTCTKGPAKNRIHNYLKKTLHNCLHLAGAEVDLERCVPELTRETHRPDGGIDAIMDVVAAFPTATRQHWIDVTTRSPHAERYNTHATANASHVPGFAASKGCQEKWDKYKSEWVVPFAYEPYGRIADESVNALELIAVQAAGVSADRWTSPMLLTRWLRDCQRMVIWASADVDLLSLGIGATKTEAAITSGSLMRSSGNLPNQSQISQSQTPPHGSTQT